MRRFSKGQWVALIVALLCVTTLVEGRTFIQNFQIIQSSVLKELGLAANTDDETILSAVDDALNQPLTACLDPCQYAP